jgi:uncharacterized protein YprB with RNaseH-like and TPR domain
VIQHKDKRKILIYDIETTPLVSYTWGLWEQNVIKVKEDWHLLSFAYKWVGDTNVTVKALPMYKGYLKNKNDDKALCEDLWKLFDEADVLVAHHGDSFDMKKSNARFIIHGMTPPSPYKTIDTKKVAKKYFKFESNKLDDLGKYLGLGEKLPTGGFDTWLGCMAGDMKMWAKMVKYNRQDVVLLEKVYLRMRDWMTNHPRTSDNPISSTCPNCNGTHLQRRGVTRNKVTTLQRLMCIDCGSWHSVRLTSEN